MYCKPTSFDSHSAPASWAHSTHSGQLPGGGPQGHGNPKTAAHIAAGKVPGVPVAGRETPVACLPLRGRCHGSVGGAAAMRGRSISWRAVRRATCDDISGCNERALQLGMQAEHSRLLYDFAALFRTLLAAGNDGVPLALFYENVVRPRRAIGTCCDRPSTACRCSSRRAPSSKPHAVRAPSSPLVRASASFGSASLGDKTAHSTVRTPSPHGTP